MKHGFRTKWVEAQSLPRLAVISTIIGTIIGTTILAIAWWIDLPDPR